MEVTIAKDECSDAGRNKKNENEEQSRGLCDLCSYIRIRRHVGRDVILSIKQLTMPPSSGEEIKKK